MNEKPLLYLVLGAAGSGRREILADLIENGTGEKEEPVVLLSDGEAAAEADGRLGTIERWHWTDEGSIDGQWPDRTGPFFFVTDGRLNPIDQIEAFKGWLQEGGGELGRVLTVVNCRLAEQHRPMVQWYEACVHFSDVVLLNRREGVANKWLSDFQARFKAQWLPCLFEMVKGGRVKNPALVLDPLALRLTHYFDEEQEWILRDAEGKVVDPEEEGEVDEDEELTAEEVQDPYLELNAAARRKREIPDLSKFLD